MNVRSAYLIWKKKRIINQAYDSFKREISYNIIEFVITIKLFRPIIMCSQEAYSEVWLG